MLCITKGEGGKTCEAEMTRTGQLDSTRIKGQVALRMKGVGMLQISFANDIWIHKVWWLNQNNTSHKLLLHLHTIASSSKAVQAECNYMLRLCCVVPSSYEYMRRRLLRDSPNLQFTHHYGITLL